MLVGIFTLPNTPVGGLTVDTTNNISSVGVFRSWRLPKIRALDKGGSVSRLPSTPSAEYQYCGTRECWRVL